MLLYIYMLSFTKLSNELNIVNIINYYIIFFFRKVYFERKNN